MAIKLKKISPKQFVSTIKSAGNAVTKPVAAAARTVTKPVAAAARTVTKPVAAAARTVTRPVAAAARTVTRPVAAAARTVARPVAAAARTVARPVAAAARTVGKTVKKTLVDTKPMGIKKPNFKKIGGALKGLAAKTPIGMAVNLAKGAAKCKGNPSCIGKEAKKTAVKYVAVQKELAKAAYKYSGAQQAVASGKALSKCRPNDAKCIAKNLAELAMAAKGLTPAGLASTIAKNIIKEQIKKKLDAEKAKRAAQKKVSQAKTQEERVLASREFQAAEQNIASADATIEASKETVVKADAEKMVALQQIEVAKLDPVTAKQASIVEQQAVHPDQPITAGPAISTSTNGEMIMGMPQKKFLMIMGALAFFILLIVILK